MPNVSSLRIVRVLRPLRTISQLPGLKKIIESLTKSIESLLNVIFLLVFLLTVFSIVGILSMRGMFHARCRLTPYPLTMPHNCTSTFEPCWNDYLSAALKSPASHRCVPFENDNKLWTQSTSPWYQQGPQNCFWPIDQDDERVCSLNSMGRYKCPTLASEVKRTCGSNFDRFGNRRFISSNEPYGFSRMNSGTFYESLNWGYTNFDTFFDAFLTMFQIITMEGWTDILYQSIDSWGTIPSVVLYLIIIVLAGHIALNLVLAVISESIEKLEQENEDQNFPVTSVLKVDEIRVDHESNQIGDRNELSKSIISNNVFQKAMMVCITLNTIVLACDHDGISDDFEKLLEIFNFILSSVFFIEMCLIIHAVGIKEYIRYAADYSPDSMDITKLLIPHILLQ